VAQHQKKTLAELISACSAARTSKTKLEPNTKKGQKESQNGIIIGIT